MIRVNNESSIQVDDLTAVVPAGPQIPQPVETDDGLLRCPWDGPQGRCLYETTRGDFNADRRYRDHYR